ncbi:hypothetical protein CgunFtcFv8_020343 [Champsocephalus gunnari]|uniref:Uncharacterized protein n=1 Tax=Champsocephalus gunnari TaxID=52237 RepID=A0AAN8E8J8_CHAGU|nr:hypothetical protein CgunFtcFv8_020343 [Champsocephalus gunnari]
MGKALCLAANLKAVRKAKWGGGVLASLRSSIVNRSQGGSCLLVQPGSPPPQPGPPQPGPAALLSGAGDRRGLDHLRLPHRSQGSSSRQAPPPAPSQAPLWCSTAL